jgi:hypothetical protein
MGKGDFVSQFGEAPDIKCIHAAGRQAALGCQTNFEEANSGENSAPTNRIAAAPVSRLSR